MNLDLTDEQAAFRDVVRTFAQEVVEPHAADADREERFPLEVVRRMGELGLFGLPFPERFGGSGADAVTVCLAIEEIGRADQSAGITLSAAVGLWAVGFFLVNHVYFLFSEEPGLEKRFGEGYRAYRANVPRWIPRLRPWQT